jgi:uncharacterized repeat protein (TIGR01451 family)
MVMSKATCFLGLGTWAVLILGSGAAVAAPTQRWNSSSVKGGDFVWIGNTSTQTSVLAASARSTAVLNLPAGAVVKYARLYWAAEVAKVTSLLSNHVALNVSCHNASGPNGVNPFTADETYSVPASKTDNWYESSGPVTDLVAACGSGVYQVGGIAAQDPLSNDAFVAWSLVVFYAFETESSDPYRNLALFDGLDAVKDGDPTTLPVSGFNVPSNYDAKLGVMAFRGDADLTGDALLCNGHALSDKNNPADDFFNGTRSWLGVPVGSLGSGNIHNNIGDVPRVDGAPNSMRGFDLDVVDIASKVASGDRLATLEATSTGDAYLLGALVTSIGTCAPNFSDSVKTYTNLSAPGKVPVAGDIIQYTILVKNTGNDDAFGVVLTDPLPAGVTYYVEAMDGGIDASTNDTTADSGIDAGAMDAGAFTNSSIVTLQLGEIAQGESKTVTFEVKINSDVKPGQSIANQASISATGKNCNVNIDSLSINGKGGGPTVITTAECSTDTANCKCDPSTKQCVECITDSDCGGTDSGRVCYRSLPTSASYDTCIDGCRGTGGNGCPSGEICSSLTSAIGYCYLYSGAGGAGGSGYINPGAGGAGGAGGASGPGTPTPGAVDAGVLIFPSYDAAGSDGAGGARYDGAIDVGGAGGVDSGYDGAIDAGVAGGTLDASVADVPLVADLGPVMDSGTMDSSAAIDVGVLVQLDSGAVDAVPVMADASPDIVPVINTGTDATVEGGSIQGGGCSCNTLGTQSSRPALGWLLLFGAVLGVGLRSRKRNR